MNAATGHSGTSAHGRLVALPNSAKVCVVFMVLLLATPALPPSRPRATPPAWRVQATARIPERPAAARSLPPIRENVRLPFAPPDEAAHRLSQIPAASARRT